MKTENDILKRYRSVFNSGFQVENFLVAADRWNFTVYKMNEIKEGVLSKQENVGMIALGEETYHPDLKGATERILRDIEAEYIHDLDRVIESHERVMSCLEDLVSKVKRA